MKAMSEAKYKTIGQVAKLLNLVDKKTGKLSTHTLRFWEKEFKQIRPKIFSGRRRYYDNASIEILKKIHFLLKDKGMTVKGVKKFLNSDNSSVDEINKLSIKAKNIRNKLEKISKMLKNLKQ